MCLLLFLVPPAAGQESQSLLSPEEEAWLDAHDRTFVVAAESGHPPYAFIEDGEYKGLAADYLQILSDRLRIEFTYQRYDTFAGMLEGIRNRDFDLLPLLSESEERRAFLAFTAPIAIANDRILVREGADPNTSLEDLAGAKLGTVVGYSTLDDVRAEHPEVQIVEFVNERAALIALSLGRIDAVVADNGVASYALRQEGITNVIVGAEFGVYDFQRIGVRSDWPELRDIIDKGLASISADERLELNRRWVDIRSDEVLVTRTELTVLLAALLAIGLGILIWIYTLRRLVANRTRELHEELEERHRIEAANSRLVAAIEQAGELVLLLQSDGTIEYVNLSVIHALGRNPGKRPFPSLATGESATMLQEALRQVASQDERWRGVVELQNDSDAVIKVSLTIAPLIEDNEHHGFIVTGQDVTASSEMAARLQQAEKLSAIGTLAGGIAHDFNNLLVPILGSAELLRHQTDESAHPLIDAITASADRSRQLVQSILSFSRQGSVERKPMELGKELRSAVEYLRGILPGPIDVRAQLDANPTILGSPAQMHQILLNLATNAADAMQDEGGTLEIRLESLAAEQCGDKTEIDGNPCCEIVVTDNGHGIEPEDLDRIFDPYFTRKETGKGTGLGLATVYRIVKDHGGTIRVESRVGEGTTFRISFPTIADVPTKVDAADSREEAANSAPLSIMLVDDDPVAMRTLSRLLEVGGYSVEPYQDPEEALAAMKDNPSGWDFVISDQSMPRMQGTQFLDAVSEINPQVPVMLLSGLGDQIESRYPAISKPIRLKKLVGEIERIRNSVPERQVS